MNRPLLAAQLADALLLQVLQRLQVQLVVAAQGVEIPGSLSVRRRVLDLAGLAFQPCGPARNVLCIVFASAGLAGQRLPLRLPVPCARFGGLRRLLVAKTLQLPVPHARLPLRVVLASAAGKDGAGMGLLVALASPTAVVPGIVFVGFDLLRQNAELGSDLLVARLLLLHGLPQRFKPTATEPFAPGAQAPERGIQPLQSSPCCIDRLLDSGEIVLYAPSQLLCGSAVVGGRLVDQQDEPVSRCLSGYVAGDRDGHRPAQGRRG